MFSQRQWKFESITNQRTDRHTWVGARDTCVSKNMIGSSFLMVSRKVDLRTVSFDVPPQEVNICQPHSFLYFFDKFCKFGDHFVSLQQILWRATTRGEHLAPTFFFVTSSNFTKFTFLLYFCVKLSTNPMSWSPSVKQEHFKTEEHSRVVILSYWPFAFPYFVIIQNQNEYGNVARNVCCFTWLKFYCSEVNFILHPDRKYLFSCSEVDYILHPDTFSRFSHSDCGRCCVLQVNQKCHITIVINIIISIHHQG